MKARRKGTNEPFQKVASVCLCSGGYILIKDVEFEQQQGTTSDHWQDLRERVAIAILQAMVTDKDFQRYSAQYKSEKAVTHADALVEKLKGE